MKEYFKKLSGNPLLWPPSIKQLKKETHLPPPSVTLFLTKLLNSEKRFPPGNTKRMIESYGYDFSSWRNERRDHNT